MYCLVFYNKYSYSRFLRVAPFDSYTCWKHQISNNSAQGRRRLEHITKTILLRRTKDQIDNTTGKKLVDLPPKVVNEHRISLSQKERQIYDRVFVLSRSSLVDYMKTHDQKEYEKKYKWSGQASTETAPPLVNAEHFTPTLNIGEYSFEK